MIYSLGDKNPIIHESTFVADNATLIGSVILHKNSSIWFNVVLRADNDVIEVGEGSNIQDGSVIHIDSGLPVIIGQHVTVGHQAMLHSCIIGDGSLIGMNATILNGAVIGKGCLIGANTLVTENMQVPDGSLVLGSPGKIIRTVDSATQDKFLAGAADYVKKIADYKKSLIKVSL